MTTDRTEEWQLGTCRGPDNGRGPGPTRHTGPHTRDKHCRNWERLRPVAPEKPVTGDEYPDCNGCGCISTENKKDWATVTIVIADASGSKYVPIGDLCSRCKTREWAWQNYRAPTPAPTTDLEGLWEQLAVVTCQLCAAGVPYDPVLKWEGAPRRHNGYAKELSKGWGSGDCTSKANAIIELLRKAGYR